MRVAVTMILTGIAVWAAEGRREIAICLWDEAGVPFEVKPLAQHLASVVFAQAGVEVAWRDGSSKAGLAACTFAVMLKTGTPSGLLPGALGFSQPYGKAPVTIFLDRIARHPKPVWPQLLAHVLAHELTHVIQGVARHSDTGIMKQTWDGYDHQGMRVGPLPFTPKDIALIHAGLDGRAAADRVK